MHNIIGGEIAETLRHIPSNINSTKRSSFLRSPRWIDFVGTVLHAIVLEHTRVNEAGTLWISHPIILNDIDISRGV